MHGAAQRDTGTRDRLYFPSLEPVCTGMPELCRTGLSENWLLKACGHRHWRALADAYDLASPDFRTIDGKRVYPAFTAIRIGAARLDMVKEEQILTFAVTLRRTGRTRFGSEITVSADNSIIAMLSMESTFIIRTAPGRNQSAARAAVASPCKLLPPVEKTQPPRPAKAWKNFVAPARGDQADLTTHIIDPSPHEDFNGADFLYFATFQAVLDRAEWHWWRNANPLLVTAERHIHLSGNMELGDRLRATLCHVRHEGDTLHHSIQLSRVSDGKAIAVAITHRRAARRETTA